MRLSSRYIHNILEEGSTRNIPQRSVVIKDHFALSDDMPWNWYPEQGEYTFLPKRGAINNHHQNFMSLAVCSSYISDVWKKKCRRRASLVVIDQKAALRRLVLDYMVASATPELRHAHSYTNLWRGHVDSLAKDSDDKDREDEGI